MRILNELGIGIAALTLCACGGGGISSDAAVSGPAAQPQEPSAEDIAAMQARMSMQRLANIIVPLVNAGSQTQARFMPALPVVNPCASSGSFTAKIDGVASGAGAALPLPAGRLEVAYVQCATDAQIALDGTVTLDYAMLTAPQNGVGYTARFGGVALKIGTGEPFSSWDVVVDGAVTAAPGEVRIAYSYGPLRQPVIEYTPAAGTTVASRTSGRVARYIAGSYLAFPSDTGTQLASLEFRGLTFELGGATYVVQSSAGPLSTTLITRDGALVGRLYLEGTYLDGADVSLTDELLPGEVFSPVEPF